MQAVIDQVRSGKWEEGWLFYTGKSDEMTLQTDAELGNIDFDEEIDEEVFPNGFKERGLYPSIETHIVDACIEWADKQLGKPDDATALLFIRYYLRFDCWPQNLDMLDRLNQPDPPQEQVMLELDRLFYDKLGEERPGTQCKAEGCTRGKIKLSLYCRVHHFESVKKKPCPFDD